MNNKTHSVKANEIDRKWYIIDANGKSLGRVASEAARLLKGKHKPTYSTHMDCGDNVIILNSNLAVLTGNKLEDKTYTRHSGYVGGLKEVKAKVMMQKHSDRAIEIAVKGMLPKNSLGRKMFTKLRVYKGSEHEQQAQKPEIWNF